MLSNLIEGVDVVAPYRLTPKVDVFEATRDKLSVMVGFPRRLALPDNRSEFATVFDGFGEIVDDYGIDPMDVSVKFCELEVINETNGIVIDIPMIDVDGFLGELWADPDLDQVLAAGGEMSHPFKIANVNRVSIEYPLIDFMVHYIWRSFLAHQTPDSWFRTAKGDTAWVKPVAQKHNVDPRTVIAVVGLLKAAYAKYEMVCKLNPKAWMECDLDNY